MSHHTYSDEELQELITSSFSWNDVLRKLNMKTMTRSLQRRIKNNHIKHDHISTYFDGLHTKLNRFTIEEIQRVVQSNTNWEKVLNEFGYKTINHISIIQKKLDKLNVDYSHLEVPTTLEHFSQPFKVKYTLEDILVEDSPYAGGMSQLLKRLKKERKWEHQCTICQLSEWNGQPIPLEIDHIDGCHTNNTYTNLRAICPNCHAQTDTYKGKNMTICKNNPKEKPKVEPKPKIIHEEKQCQGCNKPIDRRYNQCIDCKSKKAFESGQHRKVERPSYETLQSELQNQSMVQVGKKYGVSDNAIRKWLKTYEKYTKC